MSVERSFALILVLLLSLMPAYAAQLGTVALPQGVERVTSLEGITEYRLGNGLRILLFPDPSKPTATVNITYLVGSGHENYGETGMAHLLEHMLFKGSARHPNTTKELQDHGSRPNGTTWFDRTNYFETFQASDGNLEWALDLEADRMVNSFVAKKDLDSEMTVVRNEFESGENSPLNVLEERVISTAYLWHNYGKSTIGARSDIENVPIERLQAFYRNYYQPDNAILLVAGQFDEAKTLALAAKYFGPIPRPQRKLQTIYTLEPVQDGERAVALRRVGEIQGVVAAYHIPPGSHPDFAALDLASQILTNSPSGRLYKALVETKKAARVSGTNYQLKDPGIAIFQAQVPKESSIEEARDVLLATIDGIRSNPFTTEELERARARILKDIDLLLNNSNGVGLQLSEWAAMGDWRLLFVHRDRLKQVSKDDVQRAATYYFKTSNRTVGLFIPTAEPDRTEIPPAPDPITLMKDYKGDRSVSVGEAFDPSPENIDARTQRVTLPGGLKLALIPKETRGDTVSAVIRLQFGDENSLMGQSAIGRLTAQMLIRGTTKHTRQDIQDELDKLKARLTAGGGDTGVTATIETVHENLPKVLQLAAEVLQQPAFPLNEFESLRQQQIAGIEAQKTEPSAIASQAYQRHMNPYPKGDVRYVPTFDEEIADLRAITVDQLKKFHTDFYGASNGELAVVGDFDAEDVQKTAASELGTWKSPKPYAQVKNPYRKIEPVNQSFETPDKANAYFLAGMRVNIRDEDPDYPALLLSNYIIGSGINSRLFQRIRGKEGLSYGVGSSFSVAPTEDNASFLATAISAPENTLKVEAAFRDELSKILQDGFTEAEIAAAKASWLQAQQVSRAQDRELVGRIGTQTHYGRTMTWDADLQKKVQSLTSQQMLDALRRHLNLSAMTFMKGGNFKKVR
ncbi:MAG: insulinase family protein [Acidobacteria bacterium]|nr:MAG: insulinase family protein [Acidobacteriota bacterium]